MIFKTNQENLWSGKFGDKYIVRNQPGIHLASSTAFFAELLSSCIGIKSVMEFGANVGINIRALKVLLPNASFSALEINKKAVMELKKIKDLKVFHQSIFDFKADTARDFVFTRGVLIHLEPTMLPKAYEILYKTSKKYLCVGEYYNPMPVSVSYHGKENVLFKRDFAGELMDRYKRLKLVDYGFIYHRDNSFPQDDISWFLMEIC